MTQIIECPYVQIHPLPTVDEEKHKTYSLDELFLEVEAYRKQFGKGLGRSTFRRWRSALTMGANPETGRYDWEDLAHLKRVARELETGETLEEIANQIIEGVKANYGH